MREVLDDWPTNGLGNGYWLAAADGGVLSYGDAAFCGSRGVKASDYINRHFVGVAATSEGGGYWAGAADGGVFSYGDAIFYGSMGARPADPLNKPVVGIAS